MEKHTPMSSDVIFVYFLGLEILDYSIYVNRRHLASNDVVDETVIVIQDSEEELVGIFKRIIFSITKHNRTIPICLETHSY